ncbi:unnamed protein product [Pleuronectes platessa]|uniref:Secreted protein n=1 Tax=Pleuronectes platessa TaxID=8262 RepID=A0A9N7YMU8_PLEPL|nr:unnamed protein product [Pleuronectes platessa]
MAAVPGPLIAMSFCGSILADCFVLTPHNNQLRHCQRNTHSTRVRADPFPRLPPSLFHLWWLEGNGLTHLGGWGPVANRLCSTTSQGMFQRTTNSRTWCVSLLLGQRGEEQRIREGGNPEKTQHDSACSSRLACTSFWSQL